MSSRERPADVASGLAPHVAGRPPAEVRVPLVACDRCTSEGPAHYCGRHMERECGDCAEVCRANGTWAL